jgi:hypothetical protein
MFCVWGRSVASGSYTDAQCGTVGRTITTVNAVFQCRTLGSLINKLIYENSIVERFMSSVGFLHPSV